MKTFLLVVGTASLLASPALAGNAKKSRELKVASVTSTEKAAAPAAAPSLAAAAATANVAAPELEPLSPELLALPDLPADTSSPLVPYPELEHARPLVAPVKAKKASKAPVMKFGKDYVLGTKRESAKPNADIEHIVPKGLSQAQVATVIQSHMDEIRVCWNAVPKAQRPDACTADLKLTISDSGQVTDIELDGSVPAAAHRCITSAVSHWAFPAAETRSEIEYGIALRSLETLSR